MQELRAFVKGGTRMFLLIGVAGEKSLSELTPGSSGGWR